MNDNFATRVEKIKKILASLGFDSSDYTEMRDSVLLTLTGRQKAETKHLDIKKAGLQHFAGGSIGFTQTKGEFKSGYRRIKAQKPQKPKKVR